MCRTAHAVTQMLCMSEQGFEYVTCPALPASLRMEIVCVGFQNQVLLMSSGFLAFDLISNGNDLISTSVALPPPPPPRCKYISKVVSSALHFMVFYAFWHCVCLGMAELWGFPDRDLYGEC